MRLVYFAWLRERIGKQEEEIILDAKIKNVAQLLDFLETCGENYQQALMSRQLVHVALDKVHVDHDTALEGAREIALFPPMTGG